MELYLSFCGSIPDKVETCEHVFGKAHQIVKDLTMLDFFYMMTKLHVKLYEAVLMGHSSDFKVHTNSYNHTYLDMKGIDMQMLATFLTDDGI
jgi:hypothetical protein